ncbi:unnamed protein product [Vitrella brassicaformis CCMP3155]|uniref:TLDc domain-containing protein n=2 Tax=Vitrella brassicaformis TaxID=1169539 RepID=A0A0G4EV11_VITBC|nr:unnamed protein product [Vitrella brassicaformis CCMP3155]|eukprot:CEM02441.1 unnamed protein product [Vitrella brassicaformis CCMP3155]
MDGMGKKRRAEGPPPFAAAAAAGASASDVLTGSASVDVIISRCSNSLEGLQEHTASAIRDRKEEVKAVTEEIRTMVTDKGGVGGVAEKDGVIMVNAGGQVFPVKRTALLRPYMKRRYISVLLMYHEGGLPKDADGHIYLETSSAFSFFLDKMTLIDTGRTMAIELPASKAADPLYADYHSLFMRKINCYSAPPQALPAAAAPMEVDGQGEGGGEGTVADGVERAMKDTMAAFEQRLRADAEAYKALVRQRDEIATFLTAMAPFLCSGDGEADSILSLTVMGRPVLIMRKTLERLGHNHALLTRFLTMPQHLGGHDVDQTPSEHFVTTVDFARRIATLPHNQLIRPPLVEEGDERLVKEDIETYGLKYEPLCNGVTGGDFVIETAEEWGKVIKMTGKHSPTVTLIYKSSRDRFGYSSFLNKVVGKSGLLFALQDGPTHRFGAFIDGPLTPPDDPTQANIYKVPVFLYSLSGAYETPTKIELQEKDQQVEVAGTQLAVEDDDDESTADVCIAGGYLWLGYGDPGPADDLSSCYQWIERDKLPEGHIDDSDIDDEEEDGTMDDGRRTLASTIEFECTEMEVWHITEEVNA